MSKLIIHIITPYRTIFRYNTNYTGSLREAFYRLQEGFEDAPGFAYVRFQHSGGVTIGYLLGDALYFDTWRMVDTIREEILTHGKNYRFSQLDELYASYRLGTELIEYERKWRDAHEGSHDVRQAGEPDYPWDEIHEPKDSGIHKFGAY